MVFICMAYLKHMVNGDTVSVYELGDRVSIGRHIDNDIAIEDSIVSGFHAELTKLEGTTTFKDLESTNGSYHRGKRVESLELSGGDVIAIGSHEFEFSIEMPRGLDKTQKVKKSWIPGIYYTE